MDPAELLRTVDSVHRDKKIDKEILFTCIETALVSAAKKSHGDEGEIEIHIERATGKISGSRNGQVMPQSEISQRIGAQTAKTVMIQKIREAECDMIFDKYKQLVDVMITGIVHKVRVNSDDRGGDRGGDRNRRDSRNRDRDKTTVFVKLDSNLEAILPGSEMIPREHFKQGDRIRATIAEVRKEGTRVRVILSRIRTHLVQQLFQENIPEIADGIIEIKAISREPGYRSKVAVVCSDKHVDCVGACVGMRGVRIKAIRDELAGEQIDIVDWVDKIEELIPNALKPAEIEEVIACHMLGRAIVLVNDEFLSLSIGKKGQNVRLASKLCGWDIEIMTSEELQDNLEKAVMAFSSIPGISSDLADNLVGEGFLSYGDLSIIEPDALQEMGGLTDDQTTLIIEAAERLADMEDEAESNPPEDPYVDLVEAGPEE